MRQADEAMQIEHEMSAYPAADISEKASSTSLAIVSLLAGGWGALLTFALACLIDDAGPDRTASAVQARRVAETEPPSVFDLPDARMRAFERMAKDEGPRAQTPASNAAATGGGPPALRRIALAVPAPEAPPVLEPRTETPLPERAAEYVGTWGPDMAACGSLSRRKGYLPATITEDGAKAGETLCRFRNGHRDGLAWTMTADCSERGRRWTSQVRLLVDGDRMVWSSAKGSSSYVRCGRRAG